MTERSAKRTGNALRAVVACSTLLLLTVTVLQREDQDGYQATHLVFMPRVSWEMDAGRGMLYDEAHYQPSDFRELSGLADSPNVAPHDPATAPEPRRVLGPTIRAGAALPNPAGNEIPVAAPLAVPRPASDLLVVVELRTLAPPSWQGDPPTPPPRPKPSD